jgi:DNA-binding CsgD family transcriptional regulator
VEQLLARGTAYGWLSLYTAMRFASDEEVGLDAQRLSALVPLPAAIIDLGERRLLVASPQVDEILLRGRSMDQLDLGLLVADRDRLEHLLDLVASGDIDAYQTRRGLVRDDGSIVEADNWVAASQWTAKPLALWLFAPIGEDPGGHINPPSEGSWPTAVEGLVLGVLDPVLRIERISGDVADVVRYGADDLIGRSLPELVHPADVPFLLAGAAQALVDGPGVAVAIRLRRAERDWVRLRLMFNRLRGPDARLGFAFAPPPESDADPAAKVARLEQHLWRIAGELEAAGVVSGFARCSDASEFGGVDGLTPRQWDILSRLMRGERVPGIARALFLSQSTVRNHLTALFRRFGVHSQAELLEVLRSRRGGEKRQGAAERR